MSVVVEDGTGLETANSYISLTDADTYHSDRGNATWAAATEAVRNAALINATQWLDGKYRGRWAGFRGSADQALDWPRYAAYDIDGYYLDSDAVPARIPYAAAEAALAIVDGTDLSPALDRGGRVKREKVGPIDTEFFDGAPARTVLSAVSDLVKGYVGGSGLRISL